MSPLHSPAPALALLTATALAVSLAAQAPPPPRFQAAAPAPGLNAAGSDQRGISVDFGALRTFLERDGDLVSFSRTDHTSPWQADGLASALNTSAHEGWPALADVGDVLYFVTDRSGGLGGLDLWCATRPDEEAPFTAAPTPVTVVNSPGTERDPWVNWPGTELWIASDRPGGAGGVDVYVSVDPSGQGQWVAPLLVQNVNSPFDECAPSLTRDGLHLFLSSNRPLGGGGQAGDFNIFVASRASVGVPFRAPRLVQSLSTPIDDLQALVPYIQSSAWVTRDVQGAGRIFEAPLAGVDLVAADHPVPDGGYAIALARQPGDFAALLFAPQLAVSPLQVPGIQGSFELAPGTAGLVAQSPLDATGLQPLTFYLPNQAGLIGLSLHFQGVAADGQNAWFSRTESTTILAARGGCGSKLKSCLGGCFGSLPSSIISCAFGCSWKLIFGKKSFAKCWANCMGVSFGSCLLGCAKDWVKCVF